MLQTMVKKINTFTFEFTYQCQATYVITKIQNVKNATKKLQFKHEYFQLQSPYFDRSCLFF